MQAMFLDKLSPSIEILHIRPNLLSERFSDQSEEETRHRHGDILLLAAGVRGPLSLLSTCRP